MLFTTSKFRNGVSSFCFGISTTSMCFYLSPNASPKCHTWGSRGSGQGMARGRAADDHLHTKHHWKNVMSHDCHQLAHDERCHTRVLLSRGDSRRAIARELKRSPSTISRCQGCLRTMAICGWPSTRSKHRLTTMSPSGLRRRYAVRNPAPGRERTPLRSHPG